MQKLTIIGVVGKKIAVDAQETFKKILFWVNVNEEIANPSTGEVKPVITTVRVACYKRADRADLFLKQLVPNATVLCTGVAQADLVVSKEKEFGCLSLDAREVVVIAEAPLRGQYLNFEMVGNVGTVRVNAADGNQSDSVCNFSLAHNEGKGEKSKAIWTNCAYWRPKDRCGVFPFITPGKKLFISGRPRVSLYRRGDGETGVSLECTVSQLELLSASDRGSAVGMSSFEPELPDPDPGIPTPPDFSESDELPF